MISLLLTTAMQYGGAMLVGILVGLLFKGITAGQSQKKMREYQSDIVRRDERILDLEAANDKLEKRLKGVEAKFNSDLLVMN